MSIRTSTRADYRERLLLHKQELEFQLKRVTAALEEGNEEEFAKAHRLYPAGERPFSRPKLVQRKPGAAYHLDTKSPYVAPAGVAKRRKSDELARPQAKDGQA